LPKAANRLFARPTEHRSIDASVIDWHKDEVTDESDPSNLEQALSGATAEHDVWVEVLRSYLRAPSGTFNHRAIADDKRCRFGRWLAEHAQAYQGLTEFHTLRISHQRLHTAAARLVSWADGSNRPATMTAELVDGALIDAHRDLTAAIQGLRERLASQL